MDVKYDDDVESVESDIYIPIRTIVTIQKWIRMAQAKNKYKNMLFYKGIVVRYQRKWFCKILRLKDYFKLSVFDPVFDLYKEKKFATIPFRTPTDAVEDFDA